MAGLPLTCFLGCPHGQRSKPAAHERGQGHRRPPPRAPPLLALHLLSSPQLPLPLAFGARALRAGGSAMAAPAPQPHGDAGAGPAAAAQVPSWGSARSVDVFEKLEQIGEGTYGQVCRRGPWSARPRQSRSPRRAPRRLRLAGVHGQEPRDWRDCGAEESAHGQREGRLPHHRHP